MTNPVWIQHARHAGEALGLPCLAEQAEQRVEHQVHQPEPAADRHPGHVCDGDRDRLTARLGPQPFCHRGRGINPFHHDPPGRQRQRDPAGPDGQLQHPPVPGQAGQELHRGPWVHVPVVVVIDGRPAIAVERGIIESGHGRHSSRHKAPTPRICRTRRLNPEACSSSSTAARARVSRALAVVLARSQDRVRSLPWQSVCFRPA